MANYFSEHLVVYGDNLETVAAEVKAYLDSVPAGASVELVKATPTALYYHSLTKMCRILGFVYDLVENSFPRNDVVLCSGYENGDSHWAVRKDGRELFYVTGYLDDDSEGAWETLVGGKVNAIAYERLMSVATDEIRQRYEGRQAAEHQHKAIMQTAVALKEPKWQDWLAKCEDEGQIPF